MRYPGSMLFLAFSVACQPVSSADAPRAVELVSATDCGQTPMIEARGEGFSLRFPSLAVTTGERAPEVHTMCTVVLDVTPPERSSVVRGAFEAFGNGAAATGAVGTNVSIRYFAPAERGSDAFIALEPEQGRRELTAKSTGEDFTAPCGETTRLTVLVDISARSPADNPGLASAITIKEIRVPQFIKPCESTTERTLVPVSVPAGIP